mgnify:CR=1 FL=1
MDKLGLRRDIDLALHLPIRYEDETRITRLADARALADFPVDYVAWQKPWLPREADRRVAYGDDTAHCEPVLRQRLGPPVYEDAMLVVFRAPRG